MKVVRLSPEAIDELVEAAEWSKAFPRLLGLPADLEIRRALLPRFPYALIFMDLSEHIRVLAVAHAKRRPGYWLDRVGDE